MDSPLPLPRCGFWRRAAARCIDAVLWIGVFFCGLLPMVAASVTTGARPPDWLLAGWSIAAAAAYAGYEIAGVARYGQTIGKLTMNVAVVGDDGDRPPGWKAAAIRFVTLTAMAVSLPFAGFAVCLVSAAAGSRRGDGRSWHDRPARTAVVSSTDPGP